jgi:hypothetical protein
VEFTVDDVLEFTVDDVRDAGEEACQRSADQSLSITSLFRSDVVAGAEQDDGRGERFLGVPSPRIGGQVGSSHCGSAKSEPRVGVGRSSVGGTSSSPGRRLPSLVRSPRPR